MIRKSTAKKEQHFTYFFLWQAMSQLMQGKRKDKYVRQKQQNSENNLYFMFVKCW